MQNDCWQCLTTEDGISLRIHNTNTRMALSVEEIRKKVTESKAKKIINLALLHQNRLRFHVQTVGNTPALFSPLHHVRGEGGQGVASFGVNQALWDFLAFVENLIPHDKYKTFEGLFRFLFRPMS